MDSYLSLSFELSDGIHYAYARVGGPTLYTFAYESAAGVGIQAGAAPDTATVPIPAAGVLVVSALSAFGFSLGKRRRRSTS